jgi:flavin-dependent dehydrogenase
MPMIESSVLIIGAGPAGSACAARLQQNGVSCVILEKATFPRLKPCAGWVTPEVFRNLGMCPHEYPLGLTEFSRFQIAVKNFNFTLPTRQYAIRRLEFDDWLKQQVEPVFCQHTVHKVERQGGRFIVDDKYSAPYIVGAGGTNCPVYHSFFSEVSPRPFDALVVAVEEEFRFDVSDRNCKLWFLQNGLPGYAWYVPKADGWLNIGIGGSEAALRRKGTNLKAYWKMLTEKLEKSGLVRGHEWNPLGHSYYLHRKGTMGKLGNAFLVGDALGLATVDMGEGIGPAIASGHMAADAIIYSKAYEPHRIRKSSFPSMVFSRFIR